MASVNLLVFLVILISFIGTGKNFSTYFQTRQCKEFEYNTILVVVQKFMVAQGGDLLPKGKTLT